MFHTYLTTSWRLRYPIIGAPMAYVGRGRLAHKHSAMRRFGLVCVGYFILRSNRMCAGAGRGG